MSTRRLRIAWLGRRGYDEVHALQRRLQEARILGWVDDTLLFVEHDPVITLGRAANEAHLRFPREHLIARGIEVHETGRGGDVTYHGPGQLVGYPILDLAPDRMDVRRYVTDLEGVMIDACAGFGLEATRIAGLNGCWLRGGGLGDRKIGAIGVRIRRWVTMHGFALNASTNLAHFQLIVPCGIADKGVTSLSVELDRSIPVDEARMVVEQSFVERFGYEPRTLGDPLEGVDREALDARLATLDASV